MKIKNQNNSLKMVIRSFEILKRSLRSFEIDTISWIFNDLKLFANDELFVLVVCSDDIPIKCSSVTSQWN